MGLFLSRLDAGRLGLFARARRGSAAARRGAAQALEQIADEAGAVVDNAGDRKDSGSPPPRQRVRWRTLKRLRHDGRQINAGRVPPVTLSMGLLSSLPPTHR